MFAPLVHFLVKTLPHALAEPRPTPETRSCAPRPHDKCQKAINGSFSAQRSFNFVDGPLRADVRHRRRASLVLSTDVPRGICQPRRIITRWSGSWMRHARIDRCYTRLLLNRSMLVRSPRAEDDVFSACRIEEFGN